MLNLVNLNHSETRRFMLEEVELDERSAEGLYLSSYCSETGKVDWSPLLHEAARNYDDPWLAAQLRQNHRLNVMAVRKKPKGGFTEYRVPVSAPDTLSEGEFNRFYARGLCLVAIERGIPFLEIYRAKAVMNPRPDSQMKIGTHVDPNALLRDLRAHQGMETALGVPGGPNSGLSVKLPDR